MNQPEREPAPTEGSSSALRSYAWLEAIAGPTYHYLTGVVFTRFGMVHVYSDHTIYSGKGNGEGTRLRFQDGAVIHWRQYPRGYTKTYLVTLANRFAQELS